MQPYQEEYIANCKEIAALAMCKGWEELSFEECMDKAEREKQWAEETAKQNMKLLREELFPVLDHIYEADEAEVAGLREFAGKLYDGRVELDVGLFCLIRKALLSLARRRNDRNEMIQELYWLGMGYHSICNKVQGLVERSKAQRYTSRMRLCFTEAAAYLKYFDEIEDTDTRGYILRSCANMSLGQFNSHSEKIRMVRRTLQILQDKGYQEKEPNLPWSRYIYMTHQQMAASISHSKEDTMTPQDVEDLMESVYIVYQRHFQEAEERNGKPALRPSFSYYVVEFHCGMYGIGELLKKIEAMMDDADPTDFSGQGMYGIISLPAFYCQYLKEYGNKIADRAEYIVSLYQRALEYVEVFPKTAEKGSLFMYLRQLSITYMEFEGGISYKEFMLKLLVHFAPEIYAHSKVVAEAAVVFCNIIIEEVPDFFDDIEDIRKIADPEEKRQAILRYARDSGMLHDVGKISFMNLYSKVARQWFDDEYEMAHLHTLAGATGLERRKSTELYAPVALGHHSWYDGSRGYPETYHRLECPCRQMVDVIGLLSWINNVVSAEGLYTGEVKSFEEAVEEAVALEGRRFSPLLTGWLRDKEIVGRMKNAYAEGRVEAYRQLYENQRG